MFAPGFVTLFMTGLPAACSQLPKFLHYVFEGINNNNSRWAGRHGGALIKRGEAEMLYRNEHNAPSVKKT